MSSSNGSLWSGAPGWASCIALDSTACRIILFATLALPAGATPSRRSEAVSDGLDRGFEENLGQASLGVRFLRRGPDRTVIFTDCGIVLAAADQPVRMDFCDRSSPRRAPEGLDALPGTVSYSLGPYPAGWLSGIRRFTSLRYRDVAPGIDVVFREVEGGELEYDLHLAPGADASELRFRVTGAEGLELDPAGNLVIHTSCGDIVQWVPRILGNDASESTARAGYEIRGPHELGFSVIGHDRDRALLIDPVISYSTYLGGSDKEFVSRIAVDAAGNAYIDGRTGSVDFPTAGPMPSTYQGKADAFVAKIDMSGSFLYYAAYLGGTSSDGADGGIAVDSTGSACIAGYTTSSDFPTANALQPAMKGQSDAFVAKLSPDGSRLAVSTYLGGAIENEDGGMGCERAWAIAVGADDTIYVTGHTCASDFPTLNPFQAAYGGGPDQINNNDVFVTRLSPSGTLLYSTYLGGSDKDGAVGIAVEASGAAVVVGNTKSADFPIRSALFPAYAGAIDGFAAKLTPAGNDLVYSTYLGGSSQDSAITVAINIAGETFVGGATYSADFPLVRPLRSLFEGGREGFVTKLDPTGTSIAYSTYLGGAGEDAVGRAALDGAGNLWVAGATSSPDFPLRSPIQAVIQGGQDLFIAELDPAGSWLVFGTFLGGTGSEASANGIALDAAGFVYVTGITSSVDFPTVNPLQPSLAGGAAPFGDAFVVKIGCTLSLPGAIGNTLSAVKRSQGGEMLFNWLDAPPADFYLVRQDTVKSGPLDTVRASTGSGSTGLQLPMPLEPLLFYRVAGANCKGEGPR